MTTTTYQISPLSLEEAAALRSQGGRLYVADAVPGFPCRRCLRDADIGDEMLLVSHDPFDETSPYRCASPIFLHRTTCATDPADADTAPDQDLPLQLTRRQLSVRAFDDQAMMIDAAVIDGTDLDETLRRFFGEELTELVHVHNAGRGCWATTITRQP